MARPECPIAGSPLVLHLNDRNNQQWRQQVAGHAGGFRRHLHTFWKVLI